MAEPIVSVARARVTPTEERPRTKLLTKAELAGFRVSRQRAALRDARLKQEITEVYATMPAAQAWRMSVALCAAAGMP